jgi:hypothetical protein
MFQEAGIKFKSCGKTVDDNAGPLSVRLSEY